MNQRQLTKIPKQIELDFSGSVLELELTSQGEPSVKWDDFEDGELELSESDEQINISPTFDQDDAKIEVCLPDFLSVKILCMEGSVNIDTPWQGDITIECANDMELECVQCKNVSVSCEAGSVDIGIATNVSIVTQDADINIGCVTGNLAIEAGTADIEIEESNYCTINTISGDISIGIAKTANIQSLAGSITIEECHNAAIENTSGDIEIGSMQGNLTIKSVSSEIEIGDLDTTNATISDVSGSINIDLLRVIDGIVDIKSVSDDISIGVHPETSASFNLKSSTGEIATPEGEESGEFVAGDGKALVRITTISGSIEIG
jgi:DUF4097 and DUF4098 domain-containing protein YvlB